MCHHITVRCNNREFNLSSKTCRSLLLHAISREKKKYSFRIYSLRIMSNHVITSWSPSRQNISP